MSIFDELADTDFSEVSTDYPIIAPAVYEWEIKEATKEESSSGGEYLLFKTALLTPEAEDVNGKPINPGYMLRHMINLTPSQKQIEKNGEEGAIENIKKDIKRLLEATGLETFDQTLESFVGATFYAKTKVSKEREDQKTGNVYPPSAEFAKLVPAA